jgi:hypothetical protein
VLLGFLHLWSREPEGESLSLAGEFREWCGHAASYWKIMIGRPSRKVTIQGRTLQPPEYNKKAFELKVPRWAFWLRFKKFFVLFLLYSSLFV